MSLPTITGTARITTDVVPREGKTGAPWLSLALHFQGYRKQPDDGSWAEADHFRVNAVAFGDTATWLADNVKRGDAVTVTGVLKTSSWTDAEGAQKSRPQLVIREAALPERKAKAEAPPPDPTRRDVLNRLQRGHQAA